MPFDEVKSSRTGSSPRAVEIASAAVIAVVVVFALGYFGKDRRPAIDSRIPIVFEPSKHDFGTLQQNEARIADFRLVNRSQDALKLLSVRTSCACSVPPEGLQGKILQPGGFVHVPIRFETGDRVGVIESDSDFRLESLTHPGSNYLVRATIRADILEEFSYEPHTRKVYFGEMKPGETRERLITVEAKENSNFELLSSETWGADENLQVSIQKIDSRNWQVLLKLQAEDAANIHSLQNLSGAVKLQTNNKRHPSLTFQFRATVVPPFEVTPATLVLTNHSKEQRLRLRTAQPSAIRNVAALNTEGKEKGIRFESQDAGAASYWANDHRIRIQADALKNALTLNILLDIQKNGTGSNEATSVPVKIQRLQNQ